MSNQNSLEKSGRTIYPTTDRYRYQQMVLNCLFPVFALIALGVCLKRYGITGDAFHQTADRLVYFIFFTLPASTAIYVLSSQLGSDTELAAASIVLSAMLSFLSLSTVLLIFF